MTNRTAGVVEEVRTAILGADERITERVKWNAPSFGFGGDDRVTMKLHPKDRVELVFHRGAKVRVLYGSSPSPDLRTAWRRNAVLGRMGGPDVRP